MTLVLNEKTRARTEYAVYDQRNNLLTAPGRVTIDGELFEVSGEDLQLDTDSKEAVLKRNVKTVIRRGVHGLAKNN